MCVSVCMHVYACVHLYACVRVCSMHVCLHVCIYVCMYMYRWRPAAAVGSTTNFPLPFFYYNLYFGRFLGLFVLVFVVLFCNCKSVGHGGSWRQKQVDPCEFKVSLVHIGRSRPSRAE